MFIVKLALKKNLNFSYLFKITQNLVRETYFITVHKNFYIFHNIL